MEVTEGIAAMVGADAETIIENNENQPRDFEAEARAHGWTPKEEFRGDQSKWVDAETFAKRADEVMPFLKKQNQGLKRELDDLKRQIKQASAHFSRAEERGFQRAMAELEAKHDEAVEMGNVRASKAIRQEMDDLKADVAAGSKDEADAPTTEAQRRKELDQWIETNDWYLTDQSKRAYADHVANMMGPAEQWDGGQQAWLEELGKRVDRKFAEKKPNPVNGGGNREGGKSGAKTFQNLPAEAQRVCDKWIKSGIIKSREDYVKNYDWN